MSSWDVANQLGFKKCVVLTQKFRYETIEPNATVFLETESNFSLYVIISGTCVLLQNGNLIDTIGQGKCFGDSSLLGPKDMKNVTVRSQERLVRYTMLTAILLIVNMIVILLCRVNVFTNVFWYQVLISSYV